MADFKVTASQLNTQAESLQDLNGRFKSAIEQACDFRNKS